MSDEGAICPDGMIPVAPGAAETGQIAPFCLDTLEVSRAAFGLRCPPATPLAGVAGVVLEEAHARCLREGPSEEWGKHPVAWVDPIEAIAHCEAHGHRLPTLEEWRVAALMDLDGRAKETLVDCVNLCDQGCWEVEHNPGEGWFRHRDDYPRSSPVGSYQSECPSPLGLADIHGNAREIVRDGDGFMVCGTGWRSNTYAHLEPSTWCQPQQEFGRQRDVGFRCAHDLKPPTGA